MPIESFRHRGLKRLFEQGNWRIVFRFEGANALEVDLVDYH
jgi:hypothetical protein